MSTLLNSTLSFIVGIIIARNLQPDIYGFFASTLATVTLFFSFSHLGIAQFWLKKQENLDGESEIYFILQCSLF